MNPLTKAAIGLLLTCGPVTLCADTLKGDYTFNQDRMIVNNGTIFCISAFDTRDVITAYDSFGRLLWDTDFFAKIISWNVSDKVIYVFSKKRDGGSTYITCLDRRDGTLIWQKP